MSFLQKPSVSLMHSMVQTSPTTPVAGGSWSLISIRTNVRDHFPRPNEAKRIVKHGYHKRMSTANGRRIIMRRILRGRFVLSH